MISVCCIRGAVVDRLEFKGERSSAPPHPGSCAALNSTAAAGQIERDYLLTKQQARVANFIWLAGAHSSNDCMEKKLREQLVCTRPVLGASVEHTEHQDSPSFRAMSLHALDAFQTLYAAA
jgi:hypothetical protein